MTFRKSVSVTALIFCTLISSLVFADAQDEWNDLARWMKGHRPKQANKTNMRTYRKNVISKLEGFIEKHPDYNDRARVELLLGETLLAVPNYSKAKKLFEAMAAAAGDRGTLGRLGILKTLCAQAKLVAARKRLDGFMLSFPNEESLLKFDELLRERAKTAKRRKTFKYLKRGSVFPAFTGKRLDNGESWDLSKDRGAVTLIGFWVAFNNGREVKIGRKELNAATKLHRKYADMGLVVLGIPYDRNPDRLKAYLKKIDIGWPQLRDGDKVAQSIGAHPFPYWVLVGPKGKILGKDLRGSKLDKAVRKALKKYGR
jgi:hypothetical protein